MDGWIEFWMNIIRLTLPTELARILCFVPLVFVHGFSLYISFMSLIYRWCFSLMIWKS
jgi:hypothetical protein